MKTSKPALQPSAPEECGIWLDTVQLKGKAKQKSLTRRPISKLLNPFTGGTGYSLAVALNFTQTKVEMPKTKQSAISTFFAPQRRVVNKMSTPEVLSIDPVQPSPTTSSTCDSSAATPVASGTKRRREADLDLCNSKPSVDHEWKSENVAEPEAAVWLGQAASDTPSQNMCCDFLEEQFEEMNPPQSKRRLTAPSLLSGDSQPPPLAWSQDPLLTCSQYSDSEGDFYPNSQKNTEAMNSSEPRFLNSVQSEEAFDFQMDVEGRTSTQKPCKHRTSSHSNPEKENSCSLSSKSPTKHSPLSPVGPSNHTQTEPKNASPRKHFPDKEENVDSHFKWKKPSGSPLKKTAPQPSRSLVDEDSLAMLFTQDSEGFRVIAHRGLQHRSPLKDQSNISTGVVGTSDFTFLEEEDEEDKMLFTQDSQGNLVIKH